MKYSTEITPCGVINVRCFIKVVGIGIQAILQFSISNLGGYHVGISDGRDL
jgi:hypothetical protein